MRDRSEVVQAVAVSAAIVVGTLLLIWMMRPATPGVEGSGGIMTRQPRLSLLIVLSGLAYGIYAWSVWSRRGRLRKLDWRGWVSIGFLVFLIVAILSGVFWPGGVVRHYASTPAPVTPPPTAATTPTTVHGATTPTTRAPSATTVPAPTTTGAP